MANAYLEALQERGHNPNLVIVSQPVQRDTSLKEILNLMQNKQRSFHTEPTLHKSTNTQRMPLRMLVSQKAERTSSTNESGSLKPKYFENIQLSIPPYNMVSDIASCHKIRQSQRSANSSVRMLLQNPYVTKFRCSSGNSENNTINKNESKPRFLNKTKLHAMNHNFANKTRISHMNQTSIPPHDIKENDVINKCDNDNLLGSYPQSKQMEIKLFDNEEKVITQDTFCNPQDTDKSSLPIVWEDNFDTCDRANSSNSPMSVLPSSEEIEGESLEFIWTPVQCSRSNIDECNFLEKIELTENITFSFSNLDSS